MCLALRFAETHICFERSYLKSTRADEHGSGGPLNRRSILYHFELFGGHGHKSRCRNGENAFVTVTFGSAGSEIWCDSRPGTQFSAAPLRGAEIWRMSQPIRQLADLPKPKKVSRVTRHAEQFEMVQYLPASN